MRIFCTGGSGFIGTHTIKLLSDSGHDVYVYDKKGHNDILDGKMLRYTMQGFGPDAVLHLAANSSLQKGIEDPVYDAKNNIIGTINVIQAAKNYGCKRIVFASTSAVYDPYSSKSYTEESPTNPITPYGVSKLACEHYIKISGLNHVILRYGNVYGPGQKSLGENILIARALEHMLDGAPFKVNGDGEQVRDWVFVKDVASANLNALVNPLNFEGVLNISSGLGYSVNTIIEMLKHITEFDGEIEHGHPIDGEMREVIMDNSNAIRLLKWNREISLIEGLGRTVKAWPK